MTTQLIQCPKCAYKAPDQEDLQRHLTDRFGHGKISHSESNLTKDEREIKEQEETLSRLHQRQKDMLYKSTESHVFSGDKKRLVHLQQAEIMANVEANERRKLTELLARREQKLEAEAKGRQKEYEQADTEKRRSMHNERLAIEHAHFLAKQRCPNCGAPFGTTEKCPYCGARLS